MISIQPTRDFNLIKSILTTPGLYEEIIEDGSCSPEDFIPNKNCLYLLAKNDDEVLGVIIINNITSICVQAHINILPKFWGKRFDEVATKGFNWLKHNTQILKVIAVIPEECTHVLEAVKRYGFEVEGFIKNSIKRKGRVQGQHLLGIDLKGI